MDTLERNLLELAFQPRAAVIADLLGNIVVAGSAPSLQRIVRFLGIFIAVRGIGGIELRPQLRQSRAAKSLSLCEKRDVGRILGHMTLEDDCASNIVVVE